MRTREYAYMCIRAHAVIRKQPGCHDDESGQSWKIYQLWPLFVILFPGLPYPSAPGRLAECTLANSAQQQQRRRGSVAPAVLVAGSELYRI